MVTSHDLMPRIRMDGLDGDALIVARALEAEWAAQAARYAKVTRRNAKPVQPVARSVDVWQRIEAGECPHGMAGYAAFLHALALVTPHIHGGTPGMPVVLCRVLV